MTTNVLSIDCPKVSICCISFNHKLYIRDALDSFISQRTDFQYEIVISDDCSDDGTHEIICDYKKLYPDIIKDVSPRNNIGALSNWWHVQHCAKGKYLAFCEGDDYWTDPYKLKKQVDFLDCHSDFSMCFHSACVLNYTKSKVQISCENIENKEYFTNDIFPGWVIPTASVVCRRDLVETSPKLIHPEWFKYGDIVVFLQCMQMGRVWGMNEKMSIYRMTERGAVLSQKYECDYKECMCRHYEALMLNFPLLDKKWPKNYIATYYYSRFRDHESFINRFNYLIKAFIYSPLYVSKKILKIYPYGNS